MSYRRRMTRKYRKRQRKEYFRFLRGVKSGVKEVVKSYDFRSVGGGANVVAKGGLAAHEASKAAKVAKVAHNKTIQQATTRVAKKALTKASGKAVRKIASKAAVKGVLSPLSLIPDAANFYIGFKKGYGPY